MGRMAYPAPGVNLLRNRSLLAKPLPRAECVALGNVRAVLYILNNLFQLYFWTQLFFWSRSWFTDKIITVLGYKKFITEMSDAPDC